jgi:hypothetical protein
MRISTASDAHRMRISTASPSGAGSDGAVPAPLAWLLPGLQRAGRPS